MQYEIIHYRVKLTSFTGRDLETNNPVKLNYIFIKVKWNWIKYNFDFEVNNKILHLKADPV